MFCGELTSQSDFVDESVFEADFGIVDAHHKAVFNVSSSQISEHTAPINLESAPGDLHLSVASPSLHQDSVVESTFEESFGIVDAHSKIFTVSSSQLSENTAPSILESETGDSQLSVLSPTLTNSKPFDSFHFASDARAELEPTNLLTCGY